MKKQKTKLRHRVLALALALMLCVGMLPMAAFAASAGDKCPIEGCAGHIIMKGDYLICTDCAEFSETIAQPEEPEKHEHSYGENDRCSCGELSPNHVHHFDSTSKCICGEQHTTHEWSYSQDFMNCFKHTAVCTVCGAKQYEDCTTTTEKDPYLGTVKKCMYCGWADVVQEHEHSWGKWEPDGNGYHTHKCTDPNCNEAKTEECQLTAKSDGTVSCDICGWIKFDDGKPGSGDPECEHVYGTIGTSDGQGHHTLTCVNANCGNQKTETCTFNILKGENGQPVAHYCKVCGYKVPIKESDKQYCTDLGKGHEWYPVEEVLSEDGASVLTTLKCKVCGFVEITDICNSPSKVIVHYVDEDGKTIADDKSQPVIKGTKYSITSPNIEGYKPDKTVVAGECTDGKGDEFTVTYRKAYTLTIKYHFVDCEVAGTQVAPDYTATLLPYEEYSVTSPEGPFGYAPEKGKETVVGKMGEKDTLDTVKYSPIHYTWTIYYVDEDGNTLHEPQVIPYTVENVKDLKPESFDTPDGYKIVSNNIEQTWPNPQILGNVVSKVVYEPITYTWTIKYVDGKGTELFEPVVAEFNVTTTLDSVTSPTKKGYSAKTPVVERPTDKAENQSFTVTYSLSTDFALTVVHRYLNRDGSLNHEVTEELGKFTIGYQYSTAAKNEEGYTLSLTPANANGTFGEEDVTVTYEYTANAAPVTPVIPTNPTTPSTPTPTPTPTPDPDEDIEDPDVPLGPNPGDPTPTPTPDPDEDIEDPDVPLGPNPGEPTPDPDEEIEDPDVPLAPGPVDPDAEPTPAPTTKPAPAPDKDEEISDEKVPLAKTPKTGDDTGVWMTLALASAAGLALLGLSRKRKGQNVR